MYGKFMVFSFDDVKIIYFDEKLDFLEIFQFHAFLVCIIN
jgi:hypothetical protein